MRIGWAALNAVVFVAVSLQLLPQGWVLAADDVTPPTGTIVINGNRSATNTPNVTLALTWSDGAGTGVSRMRFSNDGSTWSSWETPVASRAYTLPAGPDGHRTVRVQYLDRAGNRSAVYADYIRLDTTLPTGTILINGGASVTPTHAVTLGLTWSDGAGAGVSRMRFSNDGSTWSSWETPVASRAYTLPAGPDSHRTVRVQYLDKANNRSAVYSDYIRLDTTLPTGTIIINGGASTTASRSVVLGLAWSDGGGSGVTRMRFSDNGSTWTPWMPPKATRAHTLPAGPDGHRTVRVQYLDGAGNYSAVFKDYIRLAEGGGLVHTLTYIAGPGGTITGDSPQTVNDGTDGAPVTAVPDVNYHFTQWSDGALTATRQDLAVTADLTVTAEFAINTYTLTYTAGANGLISGPSPQTVAHGGSGAPVTAVPGGGYGFSQWSDGVLTAARTDTNVTADITVTASFAPLPVVTSFAINSGAATTMNPVVTLNNTATNAPTEYMASESPTFSGASWSAYGVSPSFTLSGGMGGVKTVYFKVRNAALVESGVVNDTIDLMERTILLPGDVPLVLRWIPSGSYQMGQYPFEGAVYNEDPVHLVTLAYGFWMGKYEVTQQQWIAVRGTWPAGELPSPWHGRGNTYPAFDISWNDAKDFITSLNAHVVSSGQGPLTVSLPSESEWEYACRAVTATRFYWGNDNFDILIGDYAWYRGNNGEYPSSDYGTKPVGRKLPNAFGLFDMSGNVQEWCEDDLHGDYTGAPSDGSAWIDSPRSSARVLRGGDWDNLSVLCRSAARWGFPPDTRAVDIGFRLAAVSRVPNVVGMTWATAVAAINAAGLAVGTVVEEFSASVPVGVVVSQNPAADAKVASGSAVSLVVSRGPETAVPDVVGMVQADAESAIVGVGLVVGPLAQSFSATVPAGNVISQNPSPGSSVALGTAVNLVVSSGPWLFGDTVTILLPGNVPLELVRIPAGSFQIGSPDTERGRNSNEGPVHPVTIGYDFYMGKYEVTQSQWLAVMGSWPGYAPSSTYGKGANYPAYFVMWGDAQTFITALNAHITETGQGPATLRLPSEAEWEYACRAGTQTRFHFGDSLEVADECEDDGVRTQYMWYCANNTPGGSKPVGGLLPNGFGLYDMSGNVYEWCEDWWHSNYTGAPADGSAWVSPSASTRVIRGGCWDNWARSCRSASRLYGPGSRIFCSDQGFRLAADH